MEDKSMDSLHFRCAIKFITFPPASFILDSPCQCFVVHPIERVVIHSLPAQLRSTCSSKTGPEFLSCQSRGTS